MRAASSTTTATRYRAACTASASRWSRAVRASRPQKSIATGPGLPRRPTSAASRPPSWSTPDHQEARHQGHLQADAESCETVESASIRWPSACVTLAFLTPASASPLDDEREDGKAPRLHYEGGINQFVTFLNQAKAAVHDQPIYMKARRTVSRSKSLAVERQLYRVDVLVRQQHQHARRRHAPLWLPRRADAHHQRLHDHQQPLEGPQGKRQRRRHPRGPDRRHQRQDSAAAVRRADQNQAGQHRGQGHRRDDRQRAPRRVPRGKPGRRQACHPEGHRRRPGAGSRSQGPRPGAAQGALDAACCPQTGGRQSASGASEIYIVEAIGRRLRQACRDRRFRRFCRSAARF